MVQSQAQGVNLVAMKVFRGGSNPPNNAVICLYTLERELDQPFVSERGLVSDGGGVVNFLEAGLM